MLISGGPVSQLSGRPWIGIEMASEANTEENVRHVLDWAAGKFKRSPFQILFPLKSRDLPSVRLLSSQLFARSNDLSVWEGVASLYGIEGLSPDWEGKPLTFPDDFIQNVILQARIEKEKWSAGIKRGSFVRVIYGNQHMLCGIVKRVAKGVADVEISLKLRTVRLTIPVRALLNLDPVPEAERQYYYSGAN